MADIAKAYVQIIPSAEGIKGSLTDMLSGEAGDAGQKAGGVFSSKMGGAMKVAAGAASGAVAATTTAVSALAKQSVDAYGEFEQLEGGIETLFGNSAPAVMKNAENAFATAGQSMNSYMETSIQSAASLINSLEGDQAKAAELMDISITDMADNVNKMGTSMEGVQNAYRGFSRGNFTMLDNLALGFAGTKEGMQQLLDKAKEITGVEYNIDSYADIVKAIHAVQGEMEISGRSAEDVAEIFANTGKQVEESLGTTAREGATTLQGSITTLQGAWENLVAGFGKENVNLDELIGNVVESAGSVLENLEPIVERVLTGIGEFVQKAAPILAQQLPVLFENVLPVLISSVSDLLGALLQALPSLLTIITANLPTLILQIVNALADNADLLIQGAVTMIITLATALTAPDMLVKLIEAAIKLILALAEGLLKAIPQLLAAIPVIISNLVQSITAGAPQIGSAALQLMKAIWDTFANADWLSLGVNIVKGIINGVVSMGGALFEAMKGLAQKALQGAKDFLGIHSPSSLFRDEIGQYIDLGIAEGIEDYSNPITTAMGNLSDMSVGKFNAANQIRQGSATSGELALAGYGDITVPVYIGNQKFGQAVVNADQVNRYRSGGR